MAVSNWHESEKKPLAKLKSLLGEPVLAMRPQSEYRLHSFKSDHIANLYLLRPLDTSPSLVTHNSSSIYGQLLISISFFSKRANLK